MSGNTLWYYARGRQKLGPFSWDDLSRLAADGSLAPRDMVWQEGTPKWVPANSFPGLFPPAPPAEAPATRLPSADPEAPATRFLSTAPPAPATRPPGTDAAEAPATRPPDPSTHAAASEQPLVPGYAILGEIDRGGMGVVYKARHLQLDRIVALKMILAGDPARFRAEAQAAARLRHPNIVPIYDVGEANGRPYFSMEFVEGGNLAGRLGGKPLQIRQAAQLLETLARAVHHAHQQNIIHRDLKPANILLEQEADSIPPVLVPKVTDFGLAKRLDSAAGHTQSGAVLGTPNYMAPEQAEGRLEDTGPWTDVYALGAVLYETLTGRPPFLGKTPQETLDQVRLDQPMRPGRVVKSTPRDLETVCLKCLEKDPRQRYASALDLAEDLRRFLAHEPILARRLGPHGRLWRWGKRHPARAAGLALLAFVTLLTLGIWSWIDRQRERESAGQGDQKTQSGEDHLGAGQPALAEPLFQQALVLYPRRRAFDGKRRRAEELLARAQGELRRQDFRRLSADAVYHILGTYWTLLPGEDPGGRRRIRSGKGHGADLRTGISRAEEALGLYGLLDEPPHLDRLSGPGLDGDAGREVRRQAAEVLFLLALARERQSQEGPDADRKAATRRALRLLTTAADLDGRSSALEQYRLRFRRQLGERPTKDEERQANRSPVTFLDHHFRAAELFRSRRRADAVWEYQIALRERPDDYWTLFRLAKSLENQGQVDQAEALFRSCIALRPADPTAYNNRGTVLSSRRRFREAIEAFEAALRQDPNYSMAYGNLMLAHAELKDVPATEAVLRRFLERFPGQPREEAWARNSLGVAFERVKKYDDALRCYDDAVKLDPEYAQAHHNRAVVLIQKRDFAEAERAVLRAIDLEGKKGEYHYLLGNLYAAEDRTDDAIAAYGEALRLDDGLWPAWYNRGVLRRRLKLYEKAIEDQTRALDLDPDQPEALHERALSLASRRRFEEALADVKRAIALQGEEDPAVLRTRGQVRGELGDLQGSEKDLTRAIRLAPDDPLGYRDRAVTRMRAKNWAGAIEDFKGYLERSPRAPDAPSILLDMSTAYFEMGKKGETRDALRKALALLNEAVRLRPSPTALSNRGNFLLRSGRVREAEADFTRAIDTDKLHYRAWALRGHARLRRGRYAEAAKDLTIALKDEFGTYETSLLRAVALYGAGDIPAARKDLERVAQERPNHFRGRFARGLLRLLDGENAEAAVDLSAGLDDFVLEPFARAQRARAWLRVGGGGVAAARADADELSRLLSAEGLAQLEAARIHARAASRERALELVVRAVRLQPDLRAGLAADPDLQTLRDEPAFRNLTGRP